jgi:hypothetical protein
MSFEYQVVTMFFGVIIVPLSVAILAYRIASKMELEDEIKFIFVMFSITILFCGYLVYDSNKTMKQNQEER